MTAFARLAVLICLVGCALSQYQSEERAPRYIASSEPKNAPPPPVAILKQINRHNEDGSYTYGYEAGDGSFKIETKSPAGEVKGKYGYKDDTGKLRVIEYGANKYGFQPAGEGITVAPPTLVDESAREEGSRPNKGQGGRSQYRPSEQDYDYDEPAPTPRPAPRPTPAPYRPAPQPQQQYRPAPQPQQQYRPEPQQQYRPEPQQQYRPAPSPQPQQYRPPQPAQQYRPAQQSAPTPPKPQFFAGAAPSPAQDSFFNPEPASRQYKPKQDFRPAPSYQDFNPQPAQPRFSPQFQQPSNTQTFSMLDQLLKEYALPSGGAAATHDITFGSY